MDLTFFDPACLFMRYHHMKVKDGVKYNDGLREALRARKEQAGVEDNKGDAGEDIDEIMAEAMEVETMQVDDDLDVAMADAFKVKKSRSRQLRWKTEYLVYCFFARCNISMTRIAALFGIGRILVPYTILYTLGQICCVIRWRRHFPPQHGAKCEGIPKECDEKVWACTYFHAIGRNGDFCGGCINEVSQRNIILGIQTSLNN